MSLIPNEIIAQIIDRCDIVEIIQEYIPLRRAGRNFKALCPFHNEKSPSFMVASDKQIFHCFGCGAGGNVITFIMHQERLDFPEAVRFLAQKTGITIPEVSGDKQASQSNRQQIFTVNELALNYYHHILLNGQQPEVKEARDYLKKRGVSLEIATQFKLGFALNEWDGLLKFLKQKDVLLKVVEQAGLINPREKGDGYYDRFRDRIMIPIFDIKSQCIAFGGRSLREGVAKYINSPETPVYTKGEHLYGLNLAKHAIAQEDRAIVVEGYFDMIFPFQNGIHNIVASCGTALTPQQIRLLRRCTANVTMLFDSDPAGQAAMIRSLDLLIEHDMNVKIAQLAEKEDPDSYIRNYGAEKFRQCLNEAVSLFDFKFNWLQSQYDLRSVEGRRKVSQEMLQTINKVPSEVAKFDYISQLSQRLGIPQEVLKKENLKNTPQPTTGVERIPKVVRSSEPSIRSAEQHLLNLLLEEGDWLDLGRKELDLAYIQDEHIRNIIAKIWQLYDQGEKITVSNLLLHFQEEEARRSLLNSAHELEMNQGNKDKIFRDCLDHLKRSYLKTERENLRRQIREAQLIGDRVKLQELTQKFNSLLNLER